MERLPQLAGVTDLRNDYNNLIARLGDGPILLSQRNIPVAVLLSPGEWDRIADEMKRLQRMVKADRALAEMKAGNYVDVTDEIKTWKESA